MGSSVVVGAGAAVRPSSLRPQHQAELSVRTPQACSVPVVTERQVEGFETWILVTPPPPGPPSWDE